MGGGGGVSNKIFSFHVFFAFYAISKCLKHKKNSGGSNFFLKTILSHFLFSSRFMLFPTFIIFVCKKHFFLISCFLPCFIFWGNIEKCPFIYWLNGRWFLQMVDREF